MRAIEIVDNRDGTLSLFGTMIDSAAPSSWDHSLDSTLSLAALSRELSANDGGQVQSHRGAASERNVEPLLPTPPGILL